jgi:hypothetical protein
MKSNLKIAAATAAVLLLISSYALAQPCGNAPLPACSIPEPSSLPLFVLGAVAIGVVARFFKKK